MNETLLHGRQVELARIRSSHKLPASKKEYKSAMWTAYKADDKEAYQKAAEEAEFEIPEEVMPWIEGPRVRTTETQGV